MTTDRDRSDSLVHIDVLRGLAILMVMTMHGFQWVPGLPDVLMDMAKYGQMGVQLFFVASAYTLCLSATRRVGEVRPLQSFAIRRFFRIAPMYYIGILVYGLADHLVSGHAHLAGFVDPTLERIAANVAFVHGFVPEANNNVVPGGWSIGTEMAFYALFPLLYAGLNAMARRGRLAWIVGVPFAALLVSVGTLQVVTEMTTLKLANNTFLYFNLVNQLPVFLAGMSLYFFHRERGLPGASPGRDLTGLALFTMGALGLQKILGDRAFCLIPFISALSFLFLFEWTRTCRVPGERALARIGQLSYSMYVLHFLVAWYLSLALRDWLAERLSPWIHLGVVLAATVGVTYVLARICEVLIEGPGIRLGRHLTKKL